jgi:hypothetical protein
MNNETDRFAFPDLPDEAVIAVNDFLEELYTRFQNHYFAQMHRYYHDHPAPGQSNPPQLDDPPF